MNNKWSSSKKDDTTVAVNTAKVGTSSSSSTLHAPAPSAEPSFFSTHRRRSKTYSGEEFAQHFPEAAAAISAATTTTAATTASSTGSNETMSSTATNAARAARGGSSMCVKGVSASAASTSSSRDDDSPKDLPNFGSSSALIRRNEATFANRSASLQEELMRRTNFSRRNYGSLELLFTLDREGIIQNIGKFRIENGDSRECLNTSNTIHLENPESQTRWYFKYFLGRIHQNYMIEDKNKNIYFLSVVITDANERHIPLYKVILWTKLGSQKLTLTYQHNKSITVKQILNHFQLETDKTPKEVLDPEIQKELLVLEEQEGSINFKFGVVYAKYGQLTDDEMLSNERGSPEFEKFIHLIGDKIRLKGWKRYRGGLDTSCKCYFVYPALKKTVRSNK